MPTDLHTLLSVMILNCIYWFMGYRWLVKNHCGDKVPLTDWSRQIGLFCHALTQWQLYLCNNLTLKKSNHSHSCNFAHYLSLCSVFVYAGPLALEIPVVILCVTLWSVMDVLLNWFSWEGRFLDSLWLLCVWAINHHAHMDESASCVGCGKPGSFVFRGNDIVLT